MILLLLFVSFSSHSDTIKGRIGVVDYDDVEISNLQRQIIHKESSVGTSKAKSAKQAMESISSVCQCVAHEIVLDSSNALEIIKLYDIIVDATDNVATRYLLNDASVILKKPLVSGSALRMDGQLTIYNYNNGPCYRCIFPTPPPPETVMNCSDGGVLGAVTGIIGTIQALEVIKIACGMGVTFRSIKLRPKSPSCAVCSENPTVTSLIDYVQFCGAAATDKSITQHVLTPIERVTCVDLKAIRKMGSPHLLLDVRDKNQYDIAAIPGSVNIPWKALPRRLGEVLDVVLPDADNGQKMPVYVLCRLGNDSQHAVKLLKASGISDAWDVEGGLYKWSDIVDPLFPKY
ncbi:hypothetical protein BC829DRAFT_386077 [Chytridium lagenaria]|nr:hypothetical protein BC829DRAFT_386077 [Chytridium lagenaria]